MMYEYHSNQAEDPDNVLMHALGQWRLTELFHDLVFLPQIVVRSSLASFVSSEWDLHVSVHVSPSHHYT